MLRPGDRVRPPDDLALGRPRARPRRRTGSGGRDVQRDLLAGEDALGPAVAVEHPDLPRQDQDAGDDDHDAGDERGDHPGRARAAHGTDRACRPSSSASGPEDGTGRVSWPRAQYRRRGVGPDPRRWVRPRPRRRPRRARCPSRTRPRRSRGTAPRSRCPVRSRAGPAGSPRSRPRPMRGPWSAPSASGCR